MKMNDFSIPKIPQSTFGIINTGWELGKRVYAKVFPLALAMALVNIIVQASQAVTTGQFKQMPSNTPYVKESLDFVTALTGLVILLFIYIITFILHAALISKINSEAEGKNQTLIEALYIGFDKTLPLFGVSILYFLIVLIGFVLLVIPGIYIGIALGFSYYIIVLKEVGVIESLKESYQLVCGHWWRTFVNLIAIIFVCCLAMLIVGIIMGSIMGVFGIWFHNEPAAGLMIFLIFVGIFFVQILLIPFMYSFILALYYDLKVRKGSF